jgi:hypothetical protein
MYHETLLNRLGLGEKDVKFFYIKDDEKFEIKILSSTKHGLCYYRKIDNYIVEKDTVSLYSLYIKTPTRFTKIYKLTNFMSY